MTGADFMSVVALKTVESVPVVEAHVGENNSFQ